MDGDTGDRSGDRPRPPVALVTGGARGVGAAVVRALAARGSAVAIHCHASLREARALAEDLVAAGIPALAVTANLREEGAVRALVHRVADHFGRIDAVVSCARLRLAGRFEELTGAELAGHYEVNVIGPFVVAQEAVAVMLAQESGGVILAVADGGEPRPDELAYVASQGAIRALMQSLDAECRSRHPRVRAGCVSVPDPPPPPAALAATLLSRIDELRSGNQ
jgi:NAD(P)-dependent dehydrogenase (short-subunit alcohol dehydrogenase family)